MLALLLVVMAAAWLIEAQNENPSEHVHGAVMFIRTGERTPWIVDGPRTLSAFGAQQMYNLGSNIRGRYISVNNDEGLMGHQHIAGMSPNILNNDQFLIQSIDAPYVLSSTQAFMQGLYPPYSPASNTSGPSLLDTSGILANGTAINFPLGGYQYPEINVAGPLDPNSVYIAGTQNCPESMKESNMYMTTDQFLDTRTASESFYQALDETMFNGYLSQDRIDYLNAIEIYDYLTYAYTHDVDVYETLANDSTYFGVYDKLRYLADEQAWYLWGNTSTSSSDNDYRAMAGRTLAALVLGQFQKIIMNHTTTLDANDVPIEWHPMSLFFGEHEPIISLTSLMLVDYTSKDFRALPPFASTMIFELFSSGPDTSFPTRQEDLWVRFLFQNGTDYEGSPPVYPMFGNSRNDVNMPWIDFQDLMSRIMTNALSDWCEQCNSPSLFCWGVDNSTIEITMEGQENTSGGSKVSPTVAGVIGAVVTLAVAGLLFAIAMFLGGIRFHRVQRGSKKSDLGGFKGSAKLASDADLHLPKNGAPPAGIVSFGGSDSAKKGTHERIGSWELRQKEFGSKGGDLGDESQRASFEAIEAAMSRPVEPHDRI
ncbi:phosphoglycerate mutase-like protein [Lojkania enalia]|uniref:Phosphoglycerate mutase-like protein n=1 Tax=Lojkania enalia TaxID=147567 RepID=A0A9P4KEF4_9PLEO|nr:phosphoglycerate mutase-like protein [Didymosphaeria enalia]